MYNDIGSHQSLDIDTDDRKILTIVQKDPDITHSEIASKINKSQPAVGARILKLERKHLLSMQYGINISECKIPIAVVTIYARFSKDLIESISCCPYMLNAFTTLGRTNVTVWLAGASINKLEEIVETHFRSRQDIRRVDMAVVMEPINELILPVNFNMERHDNLKCGDACHETAMFHAADATTGFVPVKKGKINQLFKIDDDDKQIIMQLQGDPEITHSEIGKIINKSQPSVGERVGKLMRNKILAVRKGVNFKKVPDLKLVQVMIGTTDVARVLKKLQACPSIIAGFRVISEKPIIAYIGGSTLDEIEDIIDQCIRSDENVTEVETMTILTYAKDLVLPFDFECEFVKGVGCVNCNYCNTKVGKAFVESIASGLPKARLVAAIRTLEHA